jgi:dTDP-glucose pyrophosphorylase
MMKRKVNIMPMAGDGIRLQNAGYRVPKPLIEIRGEPMFIKSAKCMPEADLWIFITKKSFIQNNKIDEIIKKNFVNSKIITVDETTEGQASSCYLSKKFLEDDDSIFINSCDSFISYDEKEFEIKKDISDIIVFSTDVKKVHKENPNSYGWIQKNKFEKLNLSCKKPFSEKLENERPIVGSFAFTKSSIFIKSLEKIFFKKLKINNEYYLDMAISASIDLGYKISEIKVNEYFDLGSSEELKNLR